MSTLTVTNTFANATTADATQVNTNFSDVKTFVDTHCVHKGETALEAKTGSPGKKFQNESFSVATDASGDFTRSFPVAFATTPTVVAQIEDQGANDRFFLRLTNRSTTSFSCRAFKNNGSGAATPITSETINLNYIAIGT